MIATCLIALLGLEIAEVVEQMRQDKLPILPPEVVCEWIDIESGGDADAIFSNGDRGLLGINQAFEDYFVWAYWKYDSIEFNVFHPAHNVYLMFQFFLDLMARWAFIASEPTDAIWISFANYHGGISADPDSEYANRLMKVYCHSQEGLELRDCLYDLENGMGLRRAYEAAKFGKFSQ